MVSIWNALALALPTPNQSTNLYSATDIASPPSSTYVVPNSHIMVKVTAIPGLPQTMAPSAVTNLIQTGRAALDILASRAGGPLADLNVPRIRWAISGLAIQVSDATRLRPETGGGPFRFDELNAAYEGVGVAVGRIGNKECSFGIWRVSPIIRRRVKGLGWGVLKVAELELKGGKEVNGTVGVS